MLVILFQNHHFLCDREISSSHDTEENSFCNTLEDHQRCPVYKLWLTQKENTPDDGGCFVLIFLGTPERGLTRTKTATNTLIYTRPECLFKYFKSRTYRNPLVYAKELHVEMLGDNLTRKQLAQRHGISSDRVTQWLCLLRLPDEIQQREIAHSDNWNKRVITERELRRIRR